MSNNFTYKYASGAEVTLKSTEDATVTPAVHTMHVNVDDLEMDGLGATDDDVVGAGEEGSVSAKLRRISADINALLTLMPEEGAEAAAQELLNLYLQELDNRMTDGTQATRLVDQNGIPYGIKQVGNKPRVSSMPYLYDIAEGNVPGHKAFLKLGYNADVGATSEIISAQGGVYVFPAAEQHMHLVSSSVEDDPDKGGAVAGTGIHEVTIYYLDDTFAEKTETLALNGTTAVETIASDIYRVNYVNVEVVGTGKKAAGNISVTNHAETVTYGYIPLGHNRMRQAVFTVPVNKDLYLVQFNYSTVTAAGKACQLTIEANYDEFNKRMLDGFFMPFAEITGESGSDSVEFRVPLHFSAGVDIKVIGSANASTIVNVGLRGWIE